MKKFIVFSIVLFSSLLLFSESVYYSTAQGAAEIANASADTDVVFDLSAGDEGTDYLVFGFTGEAVPDNDFAKKTGKDSVSLKQKVTTTGQESTTSALVADNTDDAIYAFWQISSGKSITLALKINSALTYTGNSGDKIPWSVTWDSNKSVESPTDDTSLKQTNVHEHDGTKPVESGSVALNISTGDLSSLILSNKRYTATLTMIVVSG